MKKILFLCMLFFSIFSFSTDGFKDLKWGSSREKVIESLGTPAYNRGNIIKYKNVKFANVYLMDLEFEFENNKLIRWTGLGYESKSELDKLASNLSEKYKGFELRYENRNDELSDILNKYKVTEYSSEGKKRIKLYYWVTTADKVSDYKYFELTYDSLSSEERLAKYLELLEGNKEDL